jgi:hypothetical protein
MVQDDEAAVYHRDKRLDAIWWVRAEEFVTESWPLIPLSRLAMGRFVPMQAGTNFGSVGTQPRGSGSFLDPHSSWDA